MKSRACYLWMVLILLGSATAGKAQRVDNRLNIYAGHLSGSFTGEQMINDQNFRFPSLYGNMGNLKGQSVKVFYRLHPFVSLGMGSTYGKASGWNYPGYLHYQGTQLEMVTVSPRLQLHSRFTQQGLFNRLKCFAELAPVVGYARCTVPSGLFTIYNPTKTMLTLPESNDPMAGLEAALGLEMALTQSAALYVSYSLQAEKVSSVYYTDTRFSMTQLNMGIAFKLLKDKRFIYR